MNKIKDFFYNKNDLIIVLLILAGAAFLILNRLDVIMQSPAKLIEENKQTQVTQEYTEPETEATDETQATDEAEATDETQATDETEE